MIPEAVGGHTGVFEEDAGVLPGALRLRDVRHHRLVHEAAEPDSEVFRQSSECERYVFTCSVRWKIDICFHSASYQYIRFAYNLFSEKRTPSYIH